MVVWFGCAFLFVYPSGAAAQGTNGCSRDTLAVDGIPVAIALCVVASHGPDANRTIAVTLAETFSARGTSFSRTANLDFFNGYTARAIDDVSLERLGMPRSLHLSLDYRGGTVTVAHALLLPGAIPLR
jgi:hypothetical protein